MPSEEFLQMRALLEAGSFMDIDDPVEARTFMDSMLEALPLAEGTSVEETEVAGRPAIWVRPAVVVPGRTMLYLHGGGYRIGSARGYRASVSHYATAMQAPALVLDYRLAPEHPFPAALDDAVAAFDWLADQPDSGRVALVGDSAGGGLALALAISVCDRGADAPCCVVAMSPWADLSVTADSYRRFGALDPVFGLAPARLAAADYLQGSPATHPLASPALATSLGGVAPVLIQASAEEVLTDDAIVMAAALRRDGVEVELDLWEEMTHVWQAGGPAVPECAEAIRRIAEFAGRHWG